jgi:menaquinone-specific isochorismate synthase
VKIRLTAYTRPIEVESIEAFAAAVGGLDVFWQRGQYSSAYAGQGVAHAVRGDGAQRFEQVKRVVQCLFDGHVHDRDAPEAVQLRLFGGFSFAPNIDDDPFWAAFGEALFVLPRLLLTRTAGFHWLTVCTVYEGNAPHDWRETARATFDDVAQRIARPLTDGVPPVPKLRATCLLTEQAAWRTMVERGIAHIQSGALRKIVLARALEAEFDAPVQPERTLTMLERTYLTAYRFLFKAVDGSAFFGATPELLAQLEDGALYSHALAGSAPRGAAPDEDDRLAQGLLNSAKDRYEHALVADWLRAKLLPLARSLDIPAEPTVKKYAHIQHLFTPVHAQIKSDTHILDLIARLHPTPALGGDPQAPAAAALAAIEPIGRGWYGAPVGWLDGRGGGEFAVAIRSAVACGARVRLYAGAGIVAESDPDKEWAETALKLKPMMTSLGIEIL